MKLSQRADTEGKPVSNATVVVAPESVATLAALSRLGSRGRTDQNGNYTAPPLAPETECL